MLRIVPHTVPRVGRSYEHFPDGFELHLLPANTNEAELSTPRCNAKRVRGERACLDAIRDYAYEEGGRVYRVGHAGQRHGDHAVTDVRQENNVSFYYGWTGNQCVVLL